MRGITFAVLVAGLCAVTACGGESTPEESYRTLQVGESWNESRPYPNRFADFPVLQMTTQGVYNQGPTVHRATAFTARPDEILFASMRGGRSYLLTGNYRTGQLTNHFTGPRLEHYSPNRYREIFKTPLPQYIEGLDIAASRDVPLAVFIVKNENALRLIDLNTDEVRVLMPPGRDPDRWLTSPVFADGGKSVVLPVFSIRCARNIPQWKRPRNPISYIRCDLNGQESQLYASEWGQTHVFQHPTRPELWVVKEGRPAFCYPKGAERDAAYRRPDMFLLNTRTGSRTPILPRNAYKQISHLQWNGRGDRIVYHGSAEGGGNFIGVMDLQLNVIWEHVFADWSFERNGSNHVIADPAGDYIFDDGLAIPGRISALDYRNSGADGAPRIVELVDWSNDWKGQPDQASHPHPAVSPDGKTLIFYGCREGKTNVYCVDISKLRTGTE